MTIFALVCGTDQALNSFSTLKAEDFTKRIASVARDSATERCSFIYVTYLPSQAGFSASASSTPDTAVPLPCFCTVLPRHKRASSVHVCPCAFMRKSASTTFVCCYKVGDTAVRLRGCIF